MRWPLRRGARRGRDGAGAPRARRARPLRLSPAEVMYEAQRAAMCASAEQEGILFEGHTSPLKTKKLSYANEAERQEGERLQRALRGRVAGREGRGRAWRSLKRTASSRSRARARPRPRQSSGRVCCGGRRQGAAGRPRSERPRRRVHEALQGTTEQPSRSFFKTRLDDPMIHAGLE